jgi:DinB superfamily
MKHLRVVCLLMVLSFAAGALAQAAAKPAGSQSQASSQPALSIASSVDREVSMLEREFVSVAEAMPEDKFNFTPEGLTLQGSDYKGVRTFAQEVKHVAATNFGLWAPVTGEKPAYDISNDNGPDSLKSKDEIIKFLKDSFATGHRAAQSLTAENSAQTVKTFFGDTPRVFATTFGVAHAFDHYGQMVEYLRMNGIVPPPSRPEPKK